MLIEKLNPNFVFEDERGCIRQLVRDGYKQVNFISSNKDVKRGGHYHRYNEELFYIISGKITLFVKYGKEEEIYHFKKGDMFKIPPNVIHSFDFNTKTFLISLYSIGVELEKGKKDIYTR